MKFLLDQGLPRTSVGELVALGHSAEHAGDLGMSRASDEEILEAARTRESVVVTLDSDSHVLLASTSAADPSVIRIRIERLKGDEIVQVVQQIVSVAETDLEDGAAVSVTQAGIRVRRLPLP